MSLTNPAHARDEESIIIYKMARGTSLTGQQYLWNLKATFKRFITRAWKSNDTRSSSRNSCRFIFLQFSLSK
jgi:hypothetical protein